MSMVELLKCIWELLRNYCGSLAVLGQISYES